MPPLFKNYFALSRNYVTVAQVSGIEIMQYQQ